MPEAEEEEKEKLFPLVDRRTPILDRIRNGKKKSGVGVKLGNIIGDAVISEDDEGLEKQANQIANEIKQGIAESLGVEVTDVSNKVPKKISKIIVEVDEEDVLTDEALSNLGLAEEDIIEMDVGDEDDEEESKESEEEEDDFL